MEELMQGSTRLIGQLFLIVMLSTGCDDSSPTPASGGGGGSAGGESAAPVKAEGGYATGRVLGEDGKPIAVADDISVSLYGVSEAGEKVSYSPAVKPDGTWRQKLVPGSYRFGRSLVKMKRGADTFQFYLEPQGSMWNKD